MFHVQVTEDNVDMCRVAPEYMLYTKEMMKGVIERAAATEPTPA